VKFALSFVLQTRRVENRKQGAM